MKRILAAGLACSLVGACAGSGSGSSSETAAPDLPRDAPAADAPGCAPPEGLGPWPVEPATSWIRRLGGAGDERVVAVAADGDGSTVALTWIGPGGRPWDPPTSPAAIGLVRLDPSGAVVWAREIANPHAAKIDAIAMAVSPSGIVLGATVTCAPAGCVDLGAGDVGGTVLVAFDATATARWHRPLSGTLTSGMALDRIGGGAVEVRDDAGTYRLFRFGSDGEPIWNVVSPAPAERLSTDRTALAFDDDGDLVVGAGLALHALDGSGALMWSTALATEPTTTGWIRSVGIGGDGAVVATATFHGVVAYAATSSACRSPGVCSFIAVAEPDGTPRLGAAIGDIDTAVLDAAVDPAGDVAILAGGGNPCGFGLQVLTSWGERIWSRPLVRCSDVGWAGAHTIAIDPASHRIRVGGELFGTTDLGTGAVCSNGGFDAFVLEVAPEPAAP